MNDYYCAKAVMKKYQTKEETCKYLSEKILGIQNGKLGNLWNCGPKDLWPMLIGNSVKVSHPFNADFLHRFLLRYKLNKRDWLWTVYINKLAKDDDNRIIQLIQMYDRGEKLEITDEKQTELGFSEEYFGEHDRHCGSYGRHQTIKTERIGKKYQWITMFNLLARISDHCKMVDRWNYPEKEDVQLFLVKGKEENKTVDISTADAQKTWIETKGIFYILSLTENILGRQVAGN